MECPICKEVIDNANVNICHTDCGHTFHTNCLMQIKGRGCPLCRHVLIEEEGMNDITIYSSFDIEGHNLYNTIFDLMTLSESVFINFSTKIKDRLADICLTALNLNYDEYIAKTTEIINVNKYKNITEHLKNIKKYLSRIAGKDPKYTVDNTNIVSDIIELNCKLIANFGFRVTITRKNIDDIIENYKGDSNKDKLIIFMLSDIKKGYMRIPVPVQPNSCSCT